MMGEVVSLGAYRVRKQAEADARRKTQHEPTGKSFCLRCGVQVSGATLLNGHTCVGRPEAPRRG